MIVLIIVVTTLALAFDFLNGIHDSSNVVATMISSRAFSPRVALGVTAVAEFSGPFLFGVAVANTIGHEVVDAGSISMPVLLIHGDSDENVPVAQTLAMEEALRAHGKDVETFIVQSGTHFFSEQQNATARRKLFDFLRRHLNRS